MNATDATETELVEALVHLSRNPRSVNRSRHIDVVLDRLLELGWGEEITGP